MKGTMWLIIAGLLSLNACDRIIDTTGFTFADTGTENKDQGQTNNEDTETADGTDGKGDTSSNAPDAGPDTDADPSQFTMTTPSNGKKIESASYSGLISVGGPAIVGSAESESYRVDLGGSSQINRQKKGE